MQKTELKQLYLTSSAIHFLVRTATQKHHCVKRNSQLFWQVELLIQLRLLSEHKQGQYLHLKLTPQGQKLVHSKWKNKKQLKKLLHKKDILNKCCTYLTIVLMILGIFTLATLASFRSSFLFLELFIALLLVEAVLVSFTWDVKHILTYRKVSLQELLNLATNHCQEQSLYKVIQHAEEKQLQNDSDADKFFQKGGFLK